MKTQDARGRIPRREFLQSGARLTGAMSVASAVLPHQVDIAAERAAPAKTIGIQVPAISFADEGVDQVLDILQRRGGVNTIFLHVFGWGRGLGGRQIPGQPLPDHGKQAYDLDFHGGNFATPHPRFYSNSVLRPADTRAPDLGKLDILEAVLPKAHQRGMKVYCCLEDNFRRDLPNIQKLSEVDYRGNRVGSFCFLNPHYRQFIIGLVEDYCKSYDADGILWFAERNGPLLNAVGASHFARINPAGATCFCRYHQAAARRAGIDIRRARSGFKQLEAFVRQTLANRRPHDGYFVEFLRVLIEYPEVLAWEKLWIDGKYQVYGDVHGTAKSCRSRMQVGFHIAHVNSFNPWFRAERRYETLAEKADFLKVVMYNNCGGPRYAHFINNLGATVFRDVPPAELMRFYNHLLNYEEKGIQEVVTAGLSSDYVYRETQRALKGVQGKCKVFPGIDVDIPTGQGQKKTTPDDVYGAVKAALGAGADGLIFSRKYSEMRLANLAGGGRAVKEVMR